MKDPLSYLVQKLLRQNKITIDFDELAFQIKSHPTYPSLHAVTGVLDHFNIENLALDIPKVVSTLEQLPKTFLAQIEIDGQKCFVVTTKIKDKYHLILGSKNKKSISESDFLKQFTGIVLAVTNDKFQTKTKHTPLFLNGTLLISFILLGIILISNISTLGNYIFLFLSLVGIYITATILKLEQGDSTILGNAFCSNPTEKKDCNAVLSSKGAIIFGSVKLSDISLIYFLGLTLSTFIFIINNVIISIPQLMSIVVLPITLYSIYYQSIVIKKWCFLCLSIVGLMWIQATFSIIYFLPNYKLTPILITALSFTSVAGIWLIISKLFKDNVELKALKINYFKFKRNFELFNNQLIKSKVINTEINGIKEIIYGNRNSSFNITIVSNPLCGHCKPVHNLVNQVIKQYSDSVNIIIRFNVNPKNTNSPSFKITSRLLEIYDTKGQLKSLKAMDDIYSNTSYENWLKKWKECIKPKDYLSILQEESSWCNDNSINFTPEILINGQSYPKIYDRSDLIYFMDDLLEEFETNNLQVPLKILETI